ncbi:MAG: glycosyltransferase family 2 protein [Candidatus Schekmanbacteria bacterium]|nr:glycosyltransferase family 2 protein [Candidatus Schekmanbacteria bacterium]
MTDSAQINALTPAFSIIIPLYNEEQSIVKVIRGLQDYLESKYVLYEIIVVDDGSKDNSCREAQKTGVQVIKHHQNKGYGAALKTGIKQARYEVVIFYDADGQHEPQLLEAIIENMKTYDMVVGARDRDSYQQVMRKPGKKVLSRVVNYLARTQIPDINSGLRGIKTSLVKIFFPLLPDGFSFSTTITLCLFKEGYSVHYVPITTKKRVGKSSVKQIRDGLNTIMLILRMIMLFDPLRIFLLPSLVITGTGLLFTAYTMMVSQEVWKSGILLISIGFLIFFFGLLADQISSLRRQILEVTNIKGKSQ